MTRWKNAFFVLVAIFAVSLAISLRVISRRSDLDSHGFGHGREVLSPDGKFMATGMVTSEGNREVSRIKVLRTDNKEIVFYHRQEVFYNDRPPLYSTGNSAKRGIDWDVDSRAVTFVLKNDVVLVVPVN